VRIHPVFCLLSVALFLGACGGAFPKGADRLSGKDLQPKTSPLIKPAQFGKVLSGSVSSPGKDRTDYRYVNLSGKGTLTVLLHWANGRAKLQLSVFDPMGRKILEGLGWGSGLKAVVAVEEPGRYPVRVRATGPKDASDYTLKVEFKTGGAAFAGKANCVCHTCKEGERKCLGNDHTITCTSVGKDCNAWVKIDACVKGVACTDGSCGSCHKCKEPSRRCRGRSRYQECEMKNGCLGWGRAQRCRGGRVCHGGKCVTKPPRRYCGDGKCNGKETSSTCPRDCKRALKCVKGKIETMYMRRERMTMYIVIGEGTPVKSGHKGYVLVGPTNQRLPGGEIHVTRVSGRYAVATTTLRRLGRNRFVCITPR